MKQILPVLLFITLLSSSCHYFHGERVRGNGNVVTQSRPFSDFSAVDVSSALDVVITQDSGFAVKVETDQNLQEYVEIYQEGDLLEVHLRNNVSLDPSRRTTVFISAPVFKSLDVSGASSISSANKINASELLSCKASGASHLEIELNAPKVEVELHGASSAELRGETRDFIAQGSGSSDIKAYDLKTENADIHVSGASNADVFASVKLEARASGASDVRYKGPATVNSNTSGAGSVKKVE
ncbi:MAG TPA: head GIN domain-containing protein [Chitinophagaceae bacterium]|nr:head GIN domain-containing protein [Chitinophagaceae bacterium]